ncbi:MAG: hypothetical protein HZC41_02205 [Chloroflexi bacterium]|nr:hypothetical protein [Chloroflexota bacterium]
MNIIVRAIFFAGSILLTKVGNGFAVPAAARQELYVPVFVTDFGITNASWSNDSTLFTFQVLLGDIGVQSDDHNNWYAYNTDHQTLVNSSLWTQPYVLPQGLPLGTESVAPAVNPESFTFLSPDGQYLLYPSQQATQNDPSCNALVIANTQTGSWEMVDKIRICNVEDFERGFLVHWSADSTAFTILTSSPHAVTPFYHITSYKPNLDAIKITNLTDFSIDSVPHTISRPFGLSSDGKEILMRTTAVINDVTQETLAIWSLDIPSQSRIIEQSKNVIVAQFAPNDDHIILYVSEDGLIQYNLESGKSTVLEPRINSMWIDRAWISPDGKHIAWVAKAKGGNSYGVYVEPMPGQ